jgi:hypothetical protein
MRAMIGFQRVDLWLDAVQTAALVFIVITQIAILRLIRDEMRRAISAMSVMSPAMGESSDLSRRIEQLEDDVAELAMRVDQRA